MTDFFAQSEVKSKNEYSNDHKGVIVAQLIDKYIPGDELLNAFIEGLDSDVESDLHFNNYFIF